jgi:hypothetical protein
MAIKTKIYLSTLNTKILSTFFMITRISKIARLPAAIREQLNQRLENGEKGKTLVHWLNTLPEVQKIIADQFAGHAIREQNLSEWKRGGYIDWLNQQQLLDLVRWNNETSTDLENCRDSTDIADNLGNFMSAELVLHARTLQKIKDPEKRWRRFRQIARELSRLRRDDHRFDRNLLRREQWESTLEPQEPGGASVPASQDEEIDEREIEAQEIAEQKKAEAELEEQQSNDEEFKIEEPLETPNSQPETNSIELSTSSTPELLNSTNGGANVPASRPGSAGVPPANCETQNSQPETGDAVAQAFQSCHGGIQGIFPGPGPTPTPLPTPQPETPNPKPETPRKKLYSDVSYRSLRHAHYYDQLSW